MTSEVALQASEDLAALEDSEAAARTKCKPLEALVIKMISLVEVDLEVDLEVVCLHSNPAFHQELQVLPQLKLKLSLKMEKESQELKRLLLIGMARRKLKLLKKLTKVMVEKKGTLTNLQMEENLKVKARKRSR